MEYVLRGPSDIAKEIAKREKKIRKRKGYTQIRLAELCNVSYGTIKKFEQTGQISLQSLIKIAMELGITDQMDALFSGVAYTSIQEVIRDAEST